MKPKTLAVFLAALFLGLALLGCGKTPTAPTPPVYQPPPPVIICNDNSCNTNSPASPSPGSSGPTCPATVTRVGINVPSQISISQPAGTYVADTTPRGPGDLAFPTDCRPLPSVLWVTTASCTVTDASAYRPLLRGLITGECLIYSVVGGVRSPIESIEVIP